MAAMKFYCDAERCIECNGCVTACKNENEVKESILNNLMKSNVVDLPRPISFNPSKNVEIVNQRPKIEHLTLVQWRVVISLKTFENHAQI